MGGKYNERENDVKKNRRNRENRKSGREGQEIVEGAEEERKKSESVRGKYMRERIM